MTICTLNVQGLMDAHKFHSVVYQLRQLNIDLACLTETDLTVAKAQEYERTQPNIPSIACEPPNGTRGSGLAFLVSSKGKNQAFISNELTRDPGGRYLAVRVQVQGDTRRTIGALGVYAPAEGTLRAEFFTWVREETERTRLQVILDDFNAVENPLDRMPPDKTLQRWWRTCRN